MTSTATSAPSASTTVADLVVGDVLMVSLHMPDAFPCTVTAVEPTGSVKFGQTGPDAVPIMRVHLSDMPRPFAGVMELAADQPVTLRA